MIYRNRRYFKILTLIAFLAGVFNFAHVAPAFAANDLGNTASKRNIADMFKPRNASPSQKKNMGSVPCYQAFCNPTTHSASAAVVINQPMGVDCPQGTNSNQRTVLAKFKAMHPECSGLNRYDDNIEGNTSSGASQNQNGNEASGAVRARNYKGNKR